MKILTEKAELMRYIFESIPLKNFIIEKRNKGCLIEAIKFLQNNFLILGNSNMNILCGYLYREHFLINHTNKKDQDIEKAIDFISSILIEDVVLKSLDYHDQLNIRWAIERYDQAMKNTNTNKSETTFLNHHQNIDNSNSTSQIVNQF